MDSHQRLQHIALSTLRVHSAEHTRLMARAVMPAIDLIQSDTFQQGLVRAQMTAIHSIVESSRQLLRESWFQNVIPSAVQAAKQVAYELATTPSHYRTLINVELATERDVLERVRIIRAFKRLFSLCSPSDKKREKTFLLKPFLAPSSQTLITGIVKILFAPLKINLETLHPTKLAA